MKKLYYKTVSCGFANDQKSRLKNLDLYVNIIYKEGMKNIP